MLHKDKIMRELEGAQNLLWYDNHEALAYARQLWQAHGEHRLIPLSAYHGEYAAYAVDGSQVYPDRHQGLQCALINIGTVQFLYGAVTSHAYLESYPTILALPETGDVQDWVDGKRQELELAYGIRLLEQAIAQAEKQPLLLFDGSLAFCAANTKLSEMKEYFNLRYQQLLYQLFQMDADVAWYVSAPHSKELMQQLCKAAQQEKGAYDLSSITDAQLLEHVIPIGMHTTAFASASAMHYPAPLRPHFLYGNNGYEIMRIEIPEWIIGDEQRVARIIACIADQIAKGYGYPISIAEAHEQAVVTTDDKYFFYAALQSFAQQHKKTFQISQKLKKKMKLSM
ncbi:MAG: DNA double-strand break repair nuclease NurA [Candidatus Babeliales bacterium]